VGSPAHAVHASDGREHVDYDLVVANAFTVPVPLTSLRIFSGGRLLFTLRGGALEEHTLTLAGTPTTTVPLASTVKILVDVVLPQSFGRRAPKRLSEELRYTLPRDAPARTIISSTVIDGPTVRVDRGSPVRIASPVDGAGWLNSSGCCADPTSEHRTLLLPANGSFRMPELFAIDWIREVGGSFYTGDGSRLTDWPAFGVPVHAAARGVVVRVVNDRPEVPPFTTTDENPSVRRPQDYAGNGVVERIAPGKYAVYVHLQTRSVRVKVGQRLRTGQVIGLLGNTGNTTGPHLHFGVQDGPDILTSNSLPFEIDSFTVQGTAVLDPQKLGRITLAGKPRRATWSLPLIRTVDRFGPSAVNGRR
jgi:hypothetical protein